MAKDKSLTLNEKKYKAAMKAAATAEKELKSIMKSIDSLTKGHAEIEKVNKKK